MSETGGRPVQKMVRPLLVLTVLTTMAYSAKLPAHIKTCKRTEPKFNECVKAAAEDAIPYIIPGIPSIGLLPMDPMTLPGLTISQGHGPINLALQLHDAVLTGLKSIEIKSLSIDLNNNTMRFDVKFRDPVNLSGPYKVDGQVLLLPVKGEGDCNLTFTDYHVEAVFLGEAFTKDGETYMNVKEIKSNMRPSRLYLHFDNLFNGDKFLGDNMNTFLNENWKDIFAEMKSSIEAVFGATFSDIANKVFHGFPLNVLFPDK